MKIKTSTTPRSQVVFLTQIVLNLQLIKETAHKERPTDSLKFKTTLQCCWFDFFTVFQCMHISRPFIESLNYFFSSLSTMRLPNSFSYILFQIHGNDHFWATDWKIVQLLVIGPVVASCQSSWVNSLKYAILFDHSNIHEDCILWVLYRP